MNKLSVSMTRTEKVLGWIYYPIQLLVLPMLLSLFNLAAGNPLGEAELNFAYFAVNFIGVTLIFFRFLKNNGKIALSHPFNCLRYAAVGMIINWGLSYVVQIIITMVSPEFFNVNDASIGAMAQENYSLMAIGTVLLVPVAEEVLYRGLMFGALYNRNRLAAYVISVSVFAAIHVVGYIGMYEPLQLALCFLQYLPGSIALAWAYAKADSIWAPILMHIAVNQLGMASMR